MDSDFRELDKSWIRLESWIIAFEENHHSRSHRGALYVSVRGCQLDGRVSPDL